MNGIKQDRATWEKQFSSGAWDSLGSETEFAHYSLVAAYVQKHRRPASLLDVGCGSGMLLRYLDLSLVSKYTGLDLAQAALDMIQPRRPGDRYICSPLETYEPDDTWDVILFNEVLYYTQDPVGVFEKYAHALKPGGFYVISMLKKASPLAYNNRCLRRMRSHLLRGRFEIIDQVSVSRISQSATWHIVAAAPAGPKA